MLELASQGCSWTKIFDPTVLNFAYPDTSAHYWLAAIPNPGPLGEISLRGWIPEVRYFAFNSYNLLTAPFDAIADFEITPDDGLTSPFQGPALVDRSIPAGAQYTVHLAFESPPEVRSPNTLYSNELINLGDISLPNPGLALVIYRTYLPRTDITGGTGLPLIYLETTEGSQIPIGGGETCSHLVHDLADKVVLGTVNKLLIESSFPDLPLELPGISIPGSSPDPAFSVFYSLGAGLQDAGIPVPDLLANNTTGGGFFSTKSTRYAYALFSRTYGHLYLVRGKAPRYVDGSSGPPQLRYWSLCQNEFFTQRVVSCLADHETVLDEEGYYNVVVSDFGKRPEHANDQYGYNWLPWGAYPDGDFLVRHMLPTPAFKEALQNIPRGTDPVSISGEYFPVATYCEPELFESLAAEGLKPAQVFSGCKENHENGGQ